MTDKQRDTHLRPVSRTNSIRLFGNYSQRCIDSDQCLALAHNTTGAAIDERLAVPAYVRAAASRG